SRCYHYILATFSRCPASTELEMFPTILLAFPRRIVFLSCSNGMKRYLPFLIVAVVALATFGTGFALYRARKPAPVKDAAASGMHVRGKAGAPVTIEEFGDFQCPPCGIMAGTLKKLEEEEGQRLRVIFHHFPLPVHAHAREAALAAEAAQEQGHFWEMHDVLYKEQALWAKEPEVTTLFEGYARSIGLDVERFKKDLAKPEVAARVDADHELGASRGVTSTPTLFLNNVALKPDAMSATALRKAIDTAIEEKNKPKHE
ncbi:MAG TPA: DsbA family protein, partial [Chthoniobacterales bacterium]|nr:DsbA family protein [Chthoniobacterales bacterium]